MSHLCPPASFCSFYRLYGKRSTCLLALKFGNPGRQSKQEHCGQFSRLVYAQIHYINIQTYPEYNQGSMFWTKVNDFSMLLSADSFQPTLLFFHLLKTKNKKTNKKLTTKLGKELSSYKLSMLEESVMLQNTCFCFSHCLLETIVCVCVSIIHNPMLTSENTEKKWIIVRIDWD